MIRNARGPPQKRNAFPARNGRKSSSASIQAATGLPRNEDRVNLGVVEIQAGLTPSNRLFYESTVLKRVLIRKLKHSLCALRRVWVCILQVLDDRLHRLVQAVQVEAVQAHAGTAPKGRIEALCRDGCEC